MNPAFPHDDGMFLVIEGPDCSGKTTLVEVLASYMRATGDFVPVTKRFPTMGPIGQLIRDIWVGDPHAMMNLILSRSEHYAETQHQKFIHTMPWLHAADQLTEEQDTNRAIYEKRTVIYDRHHLVSSWAYQIDNHTLERLLAVGQCQGFRRPDMVFIMDVPPEELMKRLKAKKEAGKPINPLYEREDMSHLEAICNRYASYAVMHRENTVTLNGLESPEHNVKNIIETLGIVRKMYRDMLASVMNTED